MKNLHIYDINKIDFPNPVPVEYLNRKLTTAEKKELCAEIRLMKPNKNEYYKWKCIKEYLEKNGYKITEYGGKARTSLIEKL